MFYTHFMIAEHFILWLSIIAFTMGAVSITISLIFYIKLKKKVILFFCLFLISISLIIVAFIIELLYTKLFTIEDYFIMDKISSIIDHLGCTLLIFSTPYFISLLLGIEFSLPKRVIHFIIIIIYCCTFLLDFFISINIINIPFTIPDAVFGTIIYTLLFGIPGYCVIICLININKIGDRYLKRSILFFLALSAWTLAIDSVFSIILSTYYTFHLPIYFILVNILSIVFAANYFNKPLYFENQVLTEYFNNKYSISKREEEVILNVLQSLSNNEIKEKLFISLKTVESHLFSIYKKTGVKNRIQLVNLILTNKKD